MDRLGRSKKSEHPSYHPPKATKIGWGSNIPRLKKKPGQQTFQKDEKDEKDVSLFYGALQQPLMHVTKSPLNAEEDYVEKWLTRIEPEGKTYKQRLEPRKQAEGQLSSIGLEHFGHRQQMFHKSKQRHNSSSDSSLIYQPMILKSLPSHSKDVKPVKGLQENIAPPQKRQRVPQDDEIQSSVSSYRVECNRIFEKKARHKTREDRYNFETEDKKYESRNEKVIMRNQGKNGNRQKSATRSGEKLMHNFSSKNIGQDRLTIRPSSGFGLFNNGRASSPVKRRGIPNLAFSEMDFLQHSKHNIPEVNNNEARFKYRKKERRKAIRRQDEVSAFFKPSKTSLQETKINQHVNRGQEEVEGNKYEYAEEYQATVKIGSRCQSVISSKESQLANQQLDLLPERKTPPRRHPTPGNHHSTIHRSSSQISRTTDSYLSWSETQSSLVGISQKSNCPQNSSTPASVRRALHDTGIFRDTGIETRLDFGRSDRITSRPALFTNLAPKFQNIENKLSPKRTSLLSPRNKNSTTIFGRLGIDTQFCQQESLEGGWRSESIESSLSSHLTEPQNKRQTGEHEDTALMHSDSNLGLHEGSNSMLSASVDVSRETYRMPINREETAKAARIRRLETTPSVLSDSFKNKQRLESAGRVAIPCEMTAMASSDIYLRSYKDMTTRNHTTQEPMINQQDCFSSRVRHIFAQQEDKQPSDRDTAGHYYWTSRIQSDDTGSQSVSKLITQESGSSLKTPSIQPPVHIGRNEPYSRIHTKDHRSATFPLRMFTTVPREEPLFLSQLKTNYNVGQNLLNADNKMFNYTENPQAFEKSGLMSYLDDSYAEDNLVNKNNEAFFDGTDMDLAGYMELGDLWPNYDDQIVNSHQVSDAGEVEYDFFGLQRASYELGQQLNSYHDEILLNDFNREEQELI